MLDWYVICFQEKLLSVLSMVLVPSPSVHYDRVLSGSTYGSAMVGEPILLSN